MMDTPNIRFKGFTDPWEQRKVSEITRFHKQGYYTTEDYNDNKKYYLLRGTDLTENKLILKDTPKINATEKDYQSFKTKKGDFLIVRSGTVGTYGIVDVDIPAIFGSYLIDFRFDMEQVTNEFFGYFYESDLFKKQLRQIVQQSANTNINAENIKSTSITLPSIAEQKKISEYLRQIDNLITLHQRKCDEMLELKKYMLQKMFPQNGEQFPEIRFSGFIEPWEQRKLEDLYQKIRNAFVGAATPYYVDSGHFYLESNNVKDGQINHNTEVFINDEFYEKQKDNWLHAGDLVMVQSGHVGHTAVIPESLNNTAAHALIIIANPIEKTSPHFVNYQFQTPNAKDGIDSITTGNTINHILVSEIKKFEIVVPCFEEQSKIGDYFRKLDDLITLHQRKCEEFKDIKKFMLRNMFPQKG